MVLRFTLVALWLLCDVVNAGDKLLRLRGVTKFEHDSKPERLMPESPQSKLQPWRAMPQSENYSNMCLDGHLVPEVYLLGAPKAATTTMALSLMGAGVQSIHDAFNDKELHWFDGRLTWRYRGPEGRQYEYKRWLANMPACPSKGSGRRMVGDFTPDYLRMVPIREDFQTWGKFPPWGKWAKIGEIPATGTDVVTLPPLLRRFYGDSAQNVKFVVLMRDPLSRMQSAWYHSASFNFTNLCVDCRASSFQEALENHVSLLEHGKLSDWIWTGMYERQLSEWLKDFDARQFVIVPYKYFSSQGEQEFICQALSSSLSYAIDCASHGIALSQEWAHKHPAVAADSTEDLRDRFEKFMGPERRRLAKLLERMQRQGAVLAGGRSSLERLASFGIERWLREGW